MAIDLQSLVIGYWQRSPRLLGIVAYRQGLKDEALTAIRDILDQRDCTQAEGVWLDLIGGLLGLPRPVARDPAQDPRFGFDAAGAAFDQEPFESVSPAASRFPLGDAAYCALLQARGVTLLADNTLSWLLRALAYLDPAATVRDSRQGAVTLHTARPALVGLAVEVDALPLGISVQINIAAPV